MTKRRIMHVIDSLSMGGAERMMVEIANQSARDGHQVSVCVTRENGPLSADLHPDIELRVLARRSRFDFRAIRQFAQFARRNNVQVFHVHGRSSFSFVAFAHTLALVRAPILLHDHFGIEIDSSVPRWFRLWGKHHVARYVGVYAKLGDWAKAAGIPTDKISVVNNALDLSSYAKHGAASRDLHAEFNVPRDKILALMVGGLRREKGLDVLLDALAKLSGFDKTRLRVLVAGGSTDENYVRDCRTQCSALKLDETVHFLGARRDVPVLMQACDFAVIPSRSESGPLVLIEFLASGLPVVSTAVGGIAQQVKELDVALMVPPENAAALSQNIARVLAMRVEERRALGEAGRAAALRRFDISGAAQEWYALYEAMLT
jgi:glycosyltransferase involved in cell wall biosynthesis